MQVTNDLEYVMSRHVRDVSFGKWPAGDSREMTVRPDTRYPGPTMWTRARWLLKAGPADYMLAMSVASASLPVIGKHLEPLGAATAMSEIGRAHLNSSHTVISYAVFCLKKKKKPWTLFSLHISTLIQKKAPNTPQH